MIRSTNHMDVVNSCLQQIEHELRRCFWNKHQDEMNSPFRNTGAQYFNDVFTVRSYDWGDSERDDLPNFDYQGKFRVWWYKHVGRGMIWECDQVLTLEFLDKMMSDCLKSIEADFGAKRY